MHIPHILTSVLGNKGMSRQCLEVAQVHGGGQTTKPAADQGLLRRDAVWEPWLTSPKQAKIQPELWFGIVPIPSNYIIELPLLILNMY